MPNHLRNDEILSVPIILHARSSHDVKRLMPSIMRTSDFVLAYGRIRLDIRSIEYDVPAVELPVDFDVGVFRDKISIKNRNAIHIFLVHKIEPGKGQGVLNGMYISTNKVLCKNFIILTDNQSPTTLAHEIGHFFGRTCEGSPQHHAHGRTKTQFLLRRGPARENARSILHVATSLSDTQVVAVESCIEGNDC